MSETLILDSSFPSQKNPPTNPKSHQLPLPPPLPLPLPLRNPQPDRAPTPRRSENTSIAMHPG
jgi:hypothetical protein